MPWIYHNRQNVKFNINPNHLRGVKDFQSDWLTIDTDSNTVTVRKGYSWDGCTPKFFNLLGLLWVGIPDGVTIKDGFRITGKASLVHDALYQYLGDHDMTRKQCDQVFASQLKLDNFKLWWLYYGAVRTFGYIFHKLMRK